MTDEKTGEIREGITIRYIPDDDLGPEEDAMAKSRGQLVRGKTLAKLSVPVDYVSKLKHLPGMYEVDLRMVVVQESQQMRISDFRYVGDVKLGLIESTS